MKTTPEPNQVEEQNETEETRIDVYQESSRTLEQEKFRQREIRAIAKRAVNLPESEVEKALDNNVSANTFRRYVFENYFGNPKPLNTPWNGGGFRDGIDHPTVAGQILSHPEFQKMREGGRKRISFTLPNVRSLHELNRAAVTTADVGTTVMQVPGVQGVAYERLTVADLLAQGTTNAGKVQYPREESFDADATTVAEAAAKPEQAFDVEPAESNVRKIAVWTKLSTELAEDSPAAEAYLRARLGFSVQKVENAQLLSGDGLGSNLLGLLSTPGLQTQAKGADTTLDAIRKGIRSVEENTDFVCTGMVVNVHDWANIEMLKDANNRYLVGQIMIPDEFGRPRLAPALWGKPVAVSKGIAQGSVLVGAFAAAAQIFRRTGLFIEATNTNEDDRIRNLILIIAEERLALAVYAGSAFCEVTGLPA